MNKASLQIHLGQVLGKVKDIPFVNPTLVFRNAQFQIIPKSFMLDTDELVFKLTSKDLREGLTDKEWDRITNAAWNVLQKLTKGAHSDEPT